MVRVKRVYDPPSPDDGERVLVDRLWPRGLTRASARIDSWLKDIAPSDRLRRLFHSAGSTWSGFRRRYLRELDGHDECIVALRRKAAKGTVTLLYAASDTEHNNAVVLEEVILGRRRRGRLHRASGRAQEPRAWVRSPKVANVPRKRLETR